MLPRAPGTYALLLRMGHRRTVTVGKLGTFIFPAGWYAYAGSARGPGGLAARVSRHCRESKTRHWHIDYLRPYLEPVAAWFITGPERRECSWAKALIRLPRASIPSAGFGASDCRCPAHLIEFPAQPDILGLARLVGSSVSEILLDT